MKIEQEQKKNVEKRFIVSNEQLIILLRMHTVQIYRPNVNFNLNENKWKMSFSHRVCVSNKCPNTSQCQFHVLRVCFDKNVTTITLPNS